jgi:hypothetical protein
MSQNPYAPNADFAPPPESRTSVLAILSLVCSLVCIVPGLGLLGAILGISALFSISRSQGAVKGSGLAAAGIAIGLLLTVIWVGIGIGAAQFNGALGKRFIAPVAGVVSSMEAGDFKTARTSFDKSLDASVTDEQIAAFVSAYQAELGHFKSMPQSLLEMITAYSQVGPAMKNYQGGPGEIPLPGNFDKGPAIVLIEVPTNQQQNPPTAGTWVPDLSNVGVLTPTGKKIWLRTPTPPAPSTPEPPPGEAPPPSGGG